MAKRILHRLILLPVVVWATASATFFVLRMVPGDIIQSTAAQSMTPQQMARVRAEWGLDQPVLSQYVTFLRGFAAGDFGVSFNSGARVADLVWERIPPTVELAVAALMLSAGFGIVVGLVSALRRDTWTDHASRFFALLGFSVPWFWMGLMLIAAFSVSLKWTPVSGRVSPLIDYRPITNFVLVDSLLTWNGALLGDFLRSIILPATALALVGAGFLARITRTAVLEVFSYDFVRTAKSKGLGGRRVAYVHVLRNALLPVITMLGLLFGSLLGGAVVTEIVFSWPGIGKLLVDAISRRDYAVVQAAVIFIAAVYAVVNLLVDVLYAYVDPRLR
jgi:peptide/nickel transport system permease protein